MHDSYPYDPDEFQAKKKARIEEMRKPHGECLCDPSPQLRSPAALPTGSNNPLVSAPTNHEVAGFMPGRLEFEHEVDNDAEVVVKDFEFGLVYKYGGDEQPEATITRPAGDDDEEDDDEEGDEDEKDNEVRVKKEEDDVKQEPSDAEASGSRRGSVSPKKEVNGKGKEKAEEPTFDMEDEDELEVKLALLDIYFSKLDKREEAKDLIFDRGLTEYKKVGPHFSLVIVAVIDTQIQAMERKRPRDEKDLVQRYKAFAKLQTAMDYEQLIEGLIRECSAIDLRATLTADEHNLRKRIAELQEFRRMGITTASEAEAFEQARSARVSRIE